MNLNVVRWVLFLPGGIVGGGLMAWLFMVPVFVINSLLGGTNMEAWIKTPASCLQGALIVFMACMIAPEERKAIPAVIAGSVMLAIFSAGTTIAASQGDSAFTVGGLLAIGVTITAMVAMMSEAGQEAFTAVLAALGTIVFWLFSVGVQILIVAAAIALGIWMFHSCSGEAEAANMGMRCEDVQPN